MQYKQDLHAKFTRSIRQCSPSPGPSAAADGFSWTLNNQEFNTQSVKTPIVYSLSQFLTGEQRIARVVQKKREQEDKWNRVASANIKYRQQLRDKAQVSQQKHSQGRKQFLDSRVKKEKFKIKEVERKREQNSQKRKSFNDQNHRAMRKYESQTLQFWQHKYASTQKAYRNQESAQTLYEQATALKRTHEKNNIFYAQEIKQHLLSKHSHVKQRIHQLVKQQQTLLDQHSKQVKTNRHKNQCIWENRNHQLIQRVCSSQLRSQSLIKKGTKQYQQQQKNKQLYQNDHLQQIKENVKQKNMRKIMSLKDCQCQKRTRSAARQGQAEQGLPNQQIGQDLQQNNCLKSMKQSYLSNNRLDCIQSNKQRLKEKQEIKNEEKLIIENQISQALRQREQIKDQTNCLIRKARVNA